LKALNSNAIKSLLFRYRKPWYLVLGPSHAGKTTLLNKADLNIKGVDNLPPMMITATKFFNWWLADDAVFIDVGGRYLKEGRDSNYQHTSELFQGFFKLLKRYRSYKPINGLILAVNLQELTVNTKEQLQLKKLRSILNELVLTFANFPIYLIITRCDTIEGFTEFFEDLGPEERNQLFGVGFPLASQPQSLPQLFNDEYNALLTRLNERLIWRLHQENNLDKIGKIKNFPLQMEFLKSPLAKLLNVILPHTELNLRGIFFTSALQKDTPFDNLTKTVSRAFDIEQINTTHRLTTPKTFFIPEIFKRVIFPESRVYAVNPDHRLHLFTSSLVIVITLVCVFLFFTSYKYNIQVLKNAQQVINMQTKPAKPNEDLLLPTLNLLQTVITQLDSPKGPWYAQIGMQQSSKLKNKAQAIYDQLLITQFLPFLQHTLEIQLHNTQVENANQLYATLKAYLMLGDHQHFDKKFLIKWFDNYWHQLGNNTATEKLNKHLAALFEQNLKELKLDSQLINDKRALLNNIPQSRLVLTILQNQYQGSPIKLLPNTPSTLFTNLSSEIPGIYSILNFKDVYYSQIAHTCREITNGNWVLGKKPQSNFSDIMLNQLASEVKAIYLNEYAVVWNDILTKIKFEQFQNLNQIIELLELLNDPQSPLIQLITTIKNNTQPLSDSVDFSQQVSSRFLMLNSLSVDVLKNTNQVTLMAVKDYLTKIIHAPDLDRACYEAAKLRMESQQANDSITTLLHQARLLPEPLQTWHTTIAAESWRLILRNTQSFLNRIWVSTVYPQYEAILDKRYPLFKESSTDISLNDFASFFGYGGTMDIFFKNFLQPFVDNSRLYWEWKNIDGQRLNIPQPALEMFIRAALIQKMFFPEGARTPSITFSLVPVELDPNVQSFSLDLEGQTLMFQKDNEQIISLSWPGPQPNHSEIVFMDNQAKKYGLSETGPWSWFKILDKCHLESTTSPKHFKLTFELNGSAVHYELYTNGIVNPFIPGILNAFRCPENL